MTTAAMGERETPGFAVPRGLIAAGALLGLLWLLATAVSIAGEPQSPEALPDPLNVGWEPLMAIGIAIAALRRRLAVAVLGALAAVGIVAGAELLRAAVASSRSDGYSVMYSYDPAMIAVVLLMYGGLLIAAVVAAPRPRSTVRDLLLTVVLLPFSALTLLWLTEPNGLLSAALAAASGLWLVAILGISRPLPR